MQRYELTTYGSQEVRNYTTADTFAIALDALKPIQVFEYVLEKEPSGCPVRISMGFRDHHGIVHINEHENEFGRGADRLLSNVINTLHPTMPLGFFAFDKENGDPYEIYTRDNRRGSGEQTLLNLIAGVRDVLTSGAVENPVLRYYQNSNGGITLIFTNGSLHLATTPDPMDRGQHPLSFFQQRYPDILIEKIGRHKRSVQIIEAALAEKTVRIKE